MVSSDVSLSQGGGLADKQEWPPGFRFHPTDEELVLYYLKRKICRKKLKLNIIAETDVYKWDPEELPGLSILQTGDRQWFFFNPRDRKYPNGARSNRATRHGYWKATGKDRTITSNSRSVGLKKTLVFHRGRAPNGERTDWVMHEYTLDEEELKRCQNVQEYYALYKVYKKSGPGPKNGEQYGAPFREEDWNHDCPDFDNSANLDFLVDKVKEVLPNDNFKVDSQVPSLTIEELMKDLTEDALFDLPELNDCAHNLSQVSKEGMKSTLENQPSKEIIAQEPVDLFYINGVQHNLQTSFDLSPTDFTQLQLHVAPPVALDAIVHEQEIYILPEADFLEMDDLLGPEPSQRDVAKPLNNLQVEETDGLSELDLYHDAAMFLNDIGPGPDQVIIDQYDYYLDSSPFGPSEVFDHPYVEDGGLIDNQLFPNDANQSNHQFHPDGTPEAHEQEGSVLTSAEFYPGSNCDQTSGIVYGSSNFSLQGNQNQSGNDDNGTSSWFSSAIWSFVESIPTTPASAAENGLVNRAFGRMSSFSRIRVNVMNTNISAGSDSETTKSSCRKRGFIFFPVLVAAIAILWVVLGTVRIWATGITA